MGEKHRGSRALLLVCAAAFLCAGGRVSGQEDQGLHEFGRAGCATCHGPAAKGADAPALAGLSRPYAEFVRIVREGIGEMPPNSRDDVTDEQLAVIYKWLAQLSPKPGSGLGTGGSPRSPVPSP